MTVCSLLIYLAPYDRDREVEVVFKDEEGRLLGMPVSDIDQCPKSGKVEIIVR